MNKDKVKSLIALVILFISLLSTALMINVFAEEDEDVLMADAITSSEHAHTVKTGDYIPWENLRDYFDILCCCHGTDRGWLPSNTQASYLYDGGATGYTSGAFTARIDPGADIKHLTSSDIGMKVLEKTVDYHDNPFDYSSYKSWTVARYKVMEITKMKPKAAYVVAEMEENGVDYVSEVQNAWWNTDEGHTGGNGEDNDLNKESDAFQQYIWTLLGISSNDGIKYREETFKTKDKDGNEKEKTTDAAFDIEYKPEWVTGEQDGVNYDNVTVKFDYTDNTYVVGPFAIDYVSAGGKYGDRPEVQFAGITNMELYTDGSSEPLKLGEDWFLEWVAGSTRGNEAEGELKSDFPNPNETFYVKLKYREDTTKITNIKVDFRYMNAAGHFHYLEGKINACKWRVKHTDKHAYKTDSDGNTVHDPDNCTSTYWVQLTSMTEREAQLLAWGLDGARWYKTTSLERELLKTGKISVKKIVKNSEGKEISVDKYFTFKVEVNGADNSDGPEYIKVKAGKTAESKVYFWTGDETPTYNVQEIVIPEGYAFESIENASGSLDTYKTVPVICTNKVDTQEGYLEVEKKIDNSSGHGAVLNGKTFKMKATISGTFTYNGTEYKSDGNPLVIEFNVAANGTWKSDAIKWNPSAENPTYVVEEIIEENANYELVSIENASGKITTDKDKPVKVIVTNGPVKHKAKLEIIKTLDNSDLISEEDIKKIEYEFEINVDNYEPFKVNLKAERYGTGYRWYYISDYFFWYDDQTHNYTITETANEGTKLVKAIVNGVEVPVSGNSFTATLEENAEDEFTFTNELHNDFDGPKTGKIQLTKIIEQEEYLKNKDYKFYVIVYGSKFKYKNEVIEANQVIQLTNDGFVIISVDEFDKPIYDETTGVIIHIDSSLESTWNSEDFEWYGSAPKFNVEESVAGEDITHTIIPSSGTIGDSDTGIIDVKAYNNFNKKYGYIYIYKTLENQKYFEDSFIKDVVFTFKITVDGYDPITVTTTPQKINGTWTWLYLSDPYFWDEDAEAPNYVVEEMILTNGKYTYELVDAKGPEGSTYDPATNSISGKLVESSMTKEQIDAALQEKINAGLGSNITQEDYFAKTKLEFLNKLNQEKFGYLEIIKKVDHESIKDVEFTFEVTLKGLFKIEGDDKFYSTYTFSEENGNAIKASSTRSGKTPKIIWYGDAPTYSVKEVENDKAELESMINGSGRLSHNETVFVTAQNKVKKLGGYLKITKVIEGANGSNESDVFNFDVTIGDTTTSIALKAGETWTSDYIEWGPTEEAPSYNVTEQEPTNAHLVGITNGSGKLAAGTTVEVVATNSYDEKSGNFEIKKEIIADEKLLNTADIPSFSITYTVSSKSKFVVDGNTYGEGSSYTGTISLTSGETWTSPQIKWWGDVAPVVSVSEDLGTAAEIGWKKAGISNNNSSLTEGSTIKIVVSNELPTVVIIDLTMEMAGIVWKDQLDEENKNMDALGTLDPNEVGIDGVEVYVYYTGTDKLATIYADLSNTVIDQPIITNGGGNWNAPRVKVPCAEEGADSYNVVFVYDGQTYEATKFLAELGGNAQSYKDMNNADKTQYFDNSMAVDIDRSDVNGRIEKVFGKSAIDNYMHTTGAVSGPNGENTVNYTGEVVNSGMSDYTHMKSTLQTTDPETGIAYDLFKAKASTEAGGLTYPFKKDDYSGISLTSFDTYYTKLGLTQRYNYRAVYNYALHINLGLVERPKVDVEVSKDLDSAKVVINGDLTKYKFNKLADFGQDVLTRKIQAEANKISYKLGLYQTDYFYRAEMYRTDADLYDAVTDFYEANLGLKVSDLDMKVYLTYRITLQNSSQDYEVAFNEIVDYYDSSFRLITENEECIVDGQKQVVMAAGTDFDQLNWTQKAQNIKGSDGTVYNKMSTTLDGVKLGVGERKELLVTFEVNKDTYNGVQNSIILGDKSNIVEVSNYTSYKNGQLAGKIDVDSAPDNVNLTDYCKDEWFEDDTAKAPVLKLELVNENRAINGSAWEDRPNANSAIGNGIIEDDEAIIAGLTTELVEKVTVDGVEYDFLWPTNRQLPQLGGYTIESVSGFDSTTETAGAIIDETTNTVTNSEDLGKYKFNAVPTGEFVVRALYGNNKAELADADNITGDPIAITASGERFSGNEKILTANYDQDNEGYTPAIYNGHDYKATLYQPGMGDVNAKYYDLKNTSLADSRVNDVRDNEVKRLMNISESATISNPNASVLITANSVEKGHNELYEKYGMFADSAIVVFDNEMANNEKVSELNGTVLSNGTSLNVAERTEEYLVKQIDIGLIERAENKLVLDKQISSIKLITNDNKVILDAEYDINYEIVGESEAAKNTIINKLDNNKYLVAKVTLNVEKSISSDVIQAINKNENKLSNEEISGTQNLRYINVDDEILQGSTIVINYTLTAINVSEDDYTTQELSDIISSKDLNPDEMSQRILDIARALSENNRQANATVTYGDHIGKYYYTGETDGVQVTTRVRQVVDYVDNDAVFVQLDNEAKDASWKTTTEIELSGNGLEKNRLVDLSVIPEFKALDDKNREYTTETSRNIVLSLDNLDEDATTYSNATFEKMLKPYKEGLDQSEYMSTLNLVISRTVSSSDVTNPDSLYDFENLAEIVRYQNTIGRRDEIAVPGTSNPHLGTFVVLSDNFERDSSATEIVTFTPPTGIESESVMTIQILLVVAAALGIVVVGIVVIKKKVLR